MANSVFYLNAAALDLVLARYSAANPALFSGTENDDGLGLSMDYQAGAAAVDLAPTAAGKNFAVDFDSVSVTTFVWKDGKRGSKLSSLSAKVTVNAVLALAAGTLSLSGIGATGATLPDKLAAAMFNSKVVPQLAKAAGAMPLPDVRKLTHLPISLTGMAVVNRLVRVDANLGTAGDIPAVDVAADGPAAITCGVDGPALEAYANGAAGFPATADRNADGHLGVWPFRISWSASAHASADALYLHVAGGTATASVHVSAGASAELEHIGPSIDIPATSPAVNVALVVQGAKAEVYFQLPSPPNLVPHLPGVLDKIAGAIRDLVDGTADAIQDAINAKLAHATIDLFTLPGGVNLFGVELSLAWAGLRWEHNAAVATIALS